MSIFYKIGSVLGKLAYPFRKRCRITRFYDSEDMEIIKVETRKWYSLLWEERGPYQGFASIEEAEEYIKDIIFPPLIRNPEILKVIR